MKYVAHEKLKAILLANNRIVCVCLANSDLILLFFYFTAGIVNWDYDRLRRMRISNKNTEIM